MPTKRAPGLHEPDPLEKTVRTHRKRRKHHQDFSGSSITQNLVWIGSLGSLIVVPTIGGVFLGRWLDEIFASGLFWSISLMAGGLALGSWMAWRKVFGGGL